MITIFFLRTGFYRYQVPGKSLYDSFDLVAKRVKDIQCEETFLHTLKNIIPGEVLLSQKVFCSTSLRSMQTACALDTTPIAKEGLCEVFYSMSDFISKDEFYNVENNPDVTKARKKFVQGLITNNLQESYYEVIERIEKFLDLLKEEDTKNITVFSHGFFLKIIEAYIRDPQIKIFPTKLLEYFNGETETFHFCEGFSSTYDKNKFSFKEYVRRK